MARKPHFVKKCLAMPQALSFLWKINGREPGIAAQQTLLNTPDKVFEAWVYYPQQKAKGTLVMIHGMNSLGAQDPRMVKLCQIMSSLGYIAVAPTFPTICQHLILSSQQQDIFEVLSAIRDQSLLCPSGRLSIFTASFSGSITTKAASRPEISPFINAILCINILTECDVGYKQLLSNECQDVYARLIAVKNLYHLASAVDPIIDEGLEAAIKDAFSYAPDNHLQTFLNSVPSQKASELRRIVAAVKSQDYTPPKALLEKIDWGILEHFSFIEALATAPYTLYVLHSQEDKIMCPSHAHKLIAFVNEHNLSHKALITPLLDHADAKLSLDKMVDIIKVTQLLASFFALSGR